MTADDTIFPILRERTIGSTTVQTVSGRDVHAALGVGRDFSSWAKRRNEQLGFEENVDYVRFEDLSSPNLVSSKARPQKLVEYAYTIQAAKHLAMVERNDMGRRVRNYFIECERQAQLSSPGIAGAPQGELTHEQKIELIAVADRIGGVSAAANVWRELRLPELGPTFAPAPPALPAPKRTPITKVEAWACLRHLMNVHLDGTSVRVMLERAERKRCFWLPIYRDILGAHGMLVETSEHESPGWRAWKFGLLVATTMPELQKLYRFTRWEDGDQIEAALLRLPGAKPSEILEGAVSIGIRDILDDRTAP